MMEKDEGKVFIRRRMEKWIKICLIFLAFVWLCTIISKSIYVSGLPMVKTDTASKKYIEHIVRTDGIVTAGGEIAVNTQAGLRVDKIHIQNGDTVEAGDVLFTIDTADLEDLIRARETELSKLERSLSDWQVNAVIDAQKREVAILWAKEDYETADKETAVAKERAKEALEKAESELGKHLANTVPYTADNARRNAWDMYHDWVNKGYSIADKITAKEREIQDLEEQLAELENRIGKEDGAAKDGQLSVLSGDANTDPIDSTDTENANTDNENNTDDIDQDTGDKNHTGSDQDEDSNTSSFAPDAEEHQSRNPADEEKRTELLNKLRTANQELLALRDQLTKHDRDAVAQPDYSAEEAEYDAWQNTKLTLEETVQRAKESYNDASYTREVTLRQKLREIANAETTSRADSTAALYELDMK
ncbi:MAG: HlyD family secretion protein, partial [Lachnospiraceae bacterium]|nr:HlyD family secretion protein [Lachnospiraceae bacterium]